MSGSASQLWIDALQAQAACDLRYVLIAKGSESCIWQCWLYRLPPTAVAHSNGHQHARTNSSTQQGTHGSGVAGDQSRRDQLKWHAAQQTNRQTPPHGTHLTLGLYATAPGHRTSPGSTPGRRPLRQDRQVVCKRTPAGRPAAHRTAMRTGQLSRVVVLHGIRMTRRTLGSLMQPFIVPNLLHAGHENLAASVPHPTRTRKPGAGHQWVFLNGADRGFPPEPLSSATVRCCKG